MTDPAQIARSLTKAERKVLVTATTSTDAVMQRLADKGLYTFPGRHIMLRGGECKFMDVPDCFTDKGEDVRRILLQERANA